MQIKNAATPEILGLRRAADKEESFKFTFETPAKVVTEGEIEYKEAYKFNKSVEALSKKVDSMNDLLDATPTSIKFRMHEDLERIYVQLVSQETDEVVREIPPEEFLNMVATMLKNAGLLVDKRI